MREQRLMILKMLEQGKIDSGEAHRLLEVLEPGPRTETVPPWAGLGQGMARTVEDLVSRFPVAGHNEEVVCGRFDVDRPRVRLLTASGRVRVTAVEGPDYRVVVSGRDLQRGGIRVRQTARELVIEAGRDRPGRHRGTVDIEAGLPRDAVYRLTLLAANGQLMVEDLACSDLLTAAANGMLSLRDITADSVRCRTANGRISVRGKVGRLQVRAVNGRLEIEPHPRQPGSRVLLQTVNGPIKIMLPSGIACEIDAATRAGRIRVDHPDLRTTPVRAGLIGCRLNARSAPPPLHLLVRAQTVSGGIVLCRPQTQDQGGEHRVV